MLVWEYLLEPECISPGMFIGRIATKLKLVYDYFFQEE